MTNIFDEKPEPHFVVTPVEATDSAGGLPPERQVNVPLYRTTQVIWYIFYVIETFVAFRFLLKLIAANRSAGFTDFVYGVSYPFVTPFLSVVAPIRTASGHVLEWGTLLALLVWWIIAWAIVKIFAMARPVSRGEAHAKLREQEDPSRP
jgi:hypothetical protein